MKFKCVKNELMEALQTVQKAVSPRSTLPILTGILFDLKGNELALTATDLEISILKKIEVNTEEEGSLVVPARLIFDIIRNLPEALIQISTTMEGKLNITCEYVKYDIKVFPTEDYPKFPGIDKNVNIKTKNKIFNEGIKQVVKAVSRDETRPVLTGVLISINKDIIKLVSTDSYRLAVREVKGEAAAEEKMKIIVPARALDELSKILPNREEEINILIGENQIIFEFNKTMLTSRLIEGQFPNYQQLLPEEETKESRVEVEGNKHILIDAVKRVSLLTQDNTPIRLSVSGKKMKLFTENKEIGEAVEEIDLNEGKGEVEIAFNAQFLLDGISCLEEDIVVIELTGNNQPGLIKPKEKSDFLYLIMPVRVS